MKKNICCKKCGKVIAQEGAKGIEIRKKGGLTTIDIKGNFIYLVCEKKTPAGFCGEVNIIEIPK